MKEIHQKGPAYNFKLADFLWSVHCLPQPGIHLLHTIYCVILKTRIFIHLLCIAFIYRVH